MGSLVVTTAEKALAPGVVQYPVPSAKVIPQPSVQAAPPPCS